MSASRALLTLMRICAGIQVVLGIGFWTGHWYRLVNVHRTIGMLYVLALWIISALAMRAPSLRGLAAGSIVWGLVIAALGMAQQGILIGDYHWIIRVLHLVIALSAMPLAERLTRPAAVMATA
jgi:hypothetical protein